VIGLSQVIEVGHQGVEGGIDDAYNNSYGMDAIEYAEIGWQSGKRMLQTKRQQYIF
jgi:hypothetical protein